MPENPQGEWVEVKITPSPELDPRLEKAVRRFGDVLRRIHDQAAFTFEEKRDIINGAADDNGLEKLPPVVEPGEEPPPYVGYELEASAKTEEAYEQYRADFLDGQDAGQAMAIRYAVHWIQNHIGEDAAQKFLFNWNFRNQKKEDVNARAD